jgi:hypothetical protein
MCRFEYRFSFALTLVGVLLNGQSLACEPPVGFVDSPHPDIAPLAELLSHTEQIDIARGLSVALQAASRPLKDQIRQSSDLPGVGGSVMLTNGHFGGVGSRRLNCLTDGSTVVEEVLHSDGRRFSYVVWNYTSTKLRAISYGVGEFVYTPTAPDKTHVTWTYRFALNTDRMPGRLGTFGKFLFRKFFLERDYSEMMRSVLESNRLTAEAMPPETRP